jgi:hypothetical protein
MLPEGGRFGKSSYGGELGWCRGGDDLENRRTGGWFLVYNGGWLFGCWLFFAVTGTSWKELYYADVANYPKTGLYG